MEGPRAHRDTLSRRCRYIPTNTGLSIIFLPGAGGRLDGNVVRGAKSPSPPIRGGTRTEQLLRPEFRNKPSSQSHAGALEQAGCTGERQENITGKRAPLDTARNSMEGHLDIHEYQAKET